MLFLKNLSVTLVLTYILFAFLSFDVSWMFGIEDKFGAFVIRLIYIGFASIAAGISGSEKIDLVEFVKKVFKNEV